MLISTAPQRSFSDKIDQLRRHMQLAFLMQAMESRLAIAYAVARQWFGVLIRPRTPADAWLVEGLAGYLHDLFLRRFLGKNELRYRCT